jgi:hypothetical protein
VLALLDEEFGYYVLDERNHFLPAGLSRFRRSKGGHLHDDPRDGRVLTVGMLESMVVEFAAAELGAIVQNLGLMTQALGLGGFAHFAAHPWIWERALGFREVELRSSQVTGMGLVVRLVARLLGRDITVPTPVGLERDGEVLIRPYCPPYHATMRDAVHAFVEAKNGAAGTFRAADSTTAWADPDAVRAGIPGYSDRTVEAAVAYLTHVYERYGRIPAASGPFRTLLAYQASRLDPDFYARFYRPDA